jgi:ribonuclease HI
MNNDLLTLVAGKPILESIIVDAACDQSTGICAWQGMHTSTKQMLFQCGPFTGGTNNIVEFLAVVHALGYCKQNNLSIPVYTDSFTALTWVAKKHANTNAPRNNKSEKLFELLGRATKWLHENPNHNEVLKWNTKAWGENLADFNNK